MNKITNGEMDHMLVHLLVSGIFKLRLNYEENIGINIKQLPTVVPTHILC